MVFAPSVVPGRGGRIAGLAVVLACAGSGLQSAEPLPAITSQPLGPRASPSGTTMFSPLAREQTGIVTENHYDDSRMWGELEMEFSLGSVGTGVAIGDTDNDGRPDVFIVSKTGQSRLFRNLGNWQFEDVTGAAGLGGPGSGWVQKVKGWFGFGEDTAEEEKPWEQGAAFADVNNDGHLDLYVCRFVAPNQLFINQGDGTFREEAAERGLALSDACGMAAFCDFDRDGWLDVYVHTNMRNAVANPDGQRDYLLRNVGDGRFVDVTEPAGISGMTFAHAAIWWDFNQDGWPDIYVSNDFGPPDALYRNNGDGTFTDVINDVVAHMPYSSMGADLGDVNNDGLVDFFVSDMATTTHEKDQRSMAASRALSRDDENRPEVAPQYLRNALHLNTGTGSLQEAAVLTGIAATDWTWSVRFEDLDNDGYLDLHVTNGMNREYHNVDLREQIVVAENPAERRRLLRESPVLNERNLAFRNRGDLLFENVSASWGLDQDGVGFGAAFGDLDGDGDLDLVFGNYEAGATVLRNDSDTGERVIFALRGTHSNRFGVGATVRLDTSAGPQVRTLTVARGYLSSSEPILHFGLGDEARIPQVTVSWPSGHVQTFADLPAGRRYTITEPDAPPPREAGDEPSRVVQFVEASSERGLAFPAGEKMLAEANRQPLLTMTFNRRGPALAVGDLDGDGNDDALMGGTSVEPVRVAFGVAGKDAGTRLRVLEIPTQPNVPDGPGLLFDADGDGDHDVLLTKTGAGTPATSPHLHPKLLLNDGRGAFSLAPEGMLPAVPVSVGALSAADFDRNGRLDVFIGARVLPGRYPLAPRSLLLANRPGGFEDVAASVAPGLAEVGLVTSALWSDVDGDGWIDLLLALEWGGVRCFRNNQGRGFTDQSESLGFTAAGSGWWNSLAAADFNGDGRFDYVAGNQGLNSTYSASTEHPAVLFLGSFSGGNALQVIEAYYEGDRLYPRQTLKALGAAVPAVRRKYRQNDEFARASLEEILGAEKLAAAQRFAATEFRSGVFLSQPDGRFRFEPLPRAAQLAPMQGIVAGDFDGDGHADIYVVQNSYAPVHNVGRFDGGISQLLRGNGRGGFSVVPPWESGLVVPGDGKAAALIDLDHDGWPDFFVSRNNQSTLAFRNHGKAGRSMLRVDLRGPTSNPTAVGAQVAMEMHDGTIQTSEVSAGSGYYSQSTAACFFGVPEEKAPRRVTVRWPSGATSTHEVPAASRSMTIAAP